MAKTESAIRVIEETPGYWRAVFDNPPFNMMDDTIFDGLREVGAGVADGRIRYREDFVDGLEKAPEAFIGMLEGRNFGKLIVRGDSPLRHE